MKFAVLAGSVRSDRQGIKAARYVERSLAARGHEVYMDRRCARFASEFEWYAGALRVARQQGVPY